jgi:hypothetical protein
MGGRSATRSQRQHGIGMTARDVAKVLEERYKIVETFYQLEEEFITELLEESFAEEIENVMMERRVSRKGLSDKSTDKIQAKFIDNLRRRRYDGMIPGVPTLASVRGVSHLYAQPYAQRGSRPSFIDTGNYANSFRVWVEDVEE